MRNDGWSLAAALLLLFAAYTVVAIRGWRDREKWEGVKRDDRD